MRKVGVIGAGPAGMMAAYQAAYLGAKVYLIEKNSIPGRKLRVTGAGRGNLTNVNVSYEKYDCVEPQVVQCVLNQFSCNDLVDFLQELGIFTYATDDGWFYPITNSAANITEIFASQLNRIGVNQIYGRNITDIRRLPGVFQVTDENGTTWSFDKIVLASGGKAYPNLGSNGSLFPLIQKFGHGVNKINPALAPILTEGSKIHKLQGVRLNAGVSLRYETKIVAQTFGNIIFTSWGLNGPGVMDLSHHVHDYPKSDLSLHIDFLAGNYFAFEQFIERYRNTVIPLESCLAVVLPPKAILFFLSQMNIPGHQALESISGDQLKKIIETMRDFRVKVKGTKGFDQSQLSTGGVPLQEVNRDSMESKIIPGLFFAGEILDVVGPCGGYNLQWAFSSGFIAGRFAVV